MNYTIKPWAKKIPKWLLRIVAFGVYTVAIPYVFFRHYFVQMIQEWVGDLPDTVRDIKIDAFYDQDKK